jgi:molecular chaperone DnaK
VTFNIDANGILNVSARDKGTSKEQKITIQSSGGLSQDEIEKMRRDAESHAADDKRRRELAEARNEAEQHVYRMEKLIAENKEKLSEADVSAVQAAIAKVNEVKTSDDPATIRSAIDNLMQASRAMSEHLYAASGASGAEAGAAGAAGPGAGQAAGGDGASPGGEGEDVIDVEFEEKK